MARLIASVGLVILGSLGLLLGGLLLLASFLALDPEDEVAIAMWFIPLAVGTVSIVLGVFGLLWKALPPRSHSSAPTGGS